MLKDTDKPNAFVAIYRDNNVCLKMSHRNMTN